MSKKTLGVIAAVLAVVLAGALFLILRPSDAIRNAQGDLANADTFLENLRKDWRSQLPSEGLRMGKDPQCYYEIDPERNEVTGIIACGPVRRFGSSKGQVWDLFSFSSTSVNRDGDPIAKDAYPKEAGVKRPQGDLRDAGGHSPDKDADNVDLPDLPEANPDLLMTGVSPGSVTTSDVLKPGDKGKVVTPGGTLQVSSIGTAEAISTDDKGPLQAAEGHKFIVLTTTWDPSDNGYGYGSDQETTAVLDIDGKQKDVSDYMTSYSGDDSAIVASIPNDGAATLVLSYANHDQVVDLHTGERQPDPVTDVLYRSVVTQELAKSASYGPTLYYTGDYGSKEEATYNLTIDAASLTAYSDKNAGGKGWATEGSAWLVVTFEDQINGDCCTYTASGDKLGYGSWLVTADSGTQTPAVAVSHDDGYALFSVPSTAQAVSLSLTTHAVLTGYGKPDIGLDFGPSTFDISFPT